MGINMEALRNKTNNALNNPNAGARKFTNDVTFFSVQNLQDGVPYVIRLLPPDMEKNPDGFIERYYHKINGDKYLCPKTTKDTACYVCDEVLPAVAEAHNTPGVVISNDIQEILNDLYGFPKLSFYVAAKIKQLEVKEKKLFDPQPNFVPCIWDITQKSLIKRIFELFNGVYETDADGNEVLIQAGHPDLNDQYTGKTLILTKNYTKFALDIGMPHPIPAEWSDTFFGKKYPKLTAMGLKNMGQSIAISNDLIKAKIENSEWFSILVRQLYPDDEE